MGSSQPCENLVLGKSIFHAISYDADLHDFLSSLRRVARESEYASHSWRNFLYVVYKFQNRIERIDTDNRSVWLSIDHHSIQITQQIIEF